MITIKDIDIFIMTHNRANYLGESIKSLLCNTVKPDIITVLDNESVDNTEKIVYGFHNNVKYIRTYGFLGNFNKARELTRRPYVMLFHDDDILHVKYFETVIRLLNIYKNISLVTSRYTEFYNENLPVMPYRLRVSHFLFKNIKEWAEHMYYIEGIAYAPAIYRSKDFLAEKLEYFRFNKFNDWPFMCKMANHGRVILLDDPNAFFVRRHSCQDTYSIMNYPSIEQIVNWDAYFFEAMGSPSENTLEYFLFAAQSRHFSSGKFRNFLPESEKIKDNWNKLQKLRRDLFGSFIDREELYSRLKEDMDIFQKEMLSKKIIIENDFTKTERINEWLKKYTIFYFRKRNRGIYIVIFEKIKIKIWPCMRL